MNNVCLLYCLSILAHTIHSVTLNVGLLTASENALQSVQDAVGFTRVAAAVAVAWDRIQDEQLVPEYTELNLTWLYDDCVESLSAGSTIEMMQSGVHLILGPSCTDPKIVVGSIAKFYDFPLIMYGPPFTSEVTDREAYPSRIATSYSGFPQAWAAMKVLMQYQWYDVALLYEYDDQDPIQRCYLVMGELETLLNSNSISSVVHKRLMADKSVNGFVDELKMIKDSSRIIIACMESKVSRRNLLLAANEQNMDSADYVYLFIENWRFGFGSFWKGRVDDGMDNAALATARRAFVGNVAQKFSHIKQVQLDHQPINDTTEFEKQVREKFAEPPFNCNNCTEIDMTNSYVADLGDAMLIFAYAMNKTLETNPEAYMNISGSELRQNAVGIFPGYTSSLRINSNGTRDPVFVLYVLNSADQQIPLIGLEDMYNTSAGTVNILQPNSVAFATRGGVRPLNVPKCGYKGLSCPKSFAEQYLLYVLIGCACGLMLIIVIIFAIFYIVRQKSLEETRLNMQWQVPFHTLQKPSAKSMDASQRSLQSSHTVSTQHSLGSKKDTENHMFFLLDGEGVVARKHSVRPLLTKKENSSLRTLRNLDHDNLNRFVGLCLDTSQLLSVWKFCSRGSLKDILETGTLQMDWFFKYSLMRDIAEGMHFIHRSPQQYHGWLSSSTCLVDERWQVKITYYGLEFIKSVEQREPEDLLFTAPELIRDRTAISQEADIYSYAIICSQIITKKSAWDLENQENDIDELIYRIKRGGHNPIRPSLETDDHDINPSMLLLVRDCWADNPNNRPSSDQVRSLIKSLNSGRSANLMDHVFNVLETYASNLEEEVDLRMKELVEEKKKSDILLYRMLPRQVAEKLKSGQSIEPETFESVTIFFSDVVSFTTLASRCTPLQVVNLLNDLYTSFDAIIDEHDVYKVETIGDGYLCVSGLPHRNGNEHAREVAEMSFALLRAIKNFRIPHLPAERIEIRIGLHTGSCVAGVVGLTMPRYCLFGDAVNTASRMESNGRPGRVHISQETNHFLTNILGGYNTECRGEVIIKGKGAVETYWLLTADEINSRGS